MGRGRDGLKNTHPINTDTSKQAYRKLQPAGIAYIFSLALVFAFLFLAAQYESWIMPFMVMFA